MKISDKFKHFLKGILYIILASFFGVLAFIFYFYNSHQQEFEKRYDCIVVFGASVLPNKEPTSALKKRISAAQLLYQKGVSDCIIATGYKTAYNITEAQVIKNQLTASGIPEKSIILDNQGKDTYQSIFNLDKNKSYIMVSSNYHLARIYVLSKLNRIKDFVVYSLEPDQLNTNQAKHILREVLAMFYNLYEYFILQRR